MKKLLISIGLMLGSIPAMAQFFPAGGNTYSGYLVNEPALAYSNTYYIDTSVYNANRISAQVLYSSTSLAATNFQDGAQSTASFTVVSYTALSTATATENITIGSTSGLNGAILTVNGIDLLIGRDWGVTRASKASVAASLATAITTAFPNLSSTNTSNVVYTTATVGSYANAYTFSSNNSSVTVSSAKMTGGQDNAVLTIGTITVTANRDFYPLTSNAATATSLASGINSRNNNVKASAGAGGVVYSTSVLNGSAYNYSLVSSTPAALSLSASSMQNGTDPRFVLGNPLFSSSTATGFTRGLAVVFSTGSAPAYSWITNQSTYYAVPNSSFTYFLSKYSSSAVAGLTSDYVVPTSSTSQVFSAMHTYTLTPAAFAGSPTFTFQVSDDGASWATAPSTGTITPNFTNNNASPASPLQTIVDFGSFNFRYLRLNVVGPTAGGVFLKVPMAIKYDYNVRY